MRIHFTGIAGAGMSAAALLMRDQGHTVSGSDADVFPPMSTYVAALGFPVEYQFDAGNLPPELDLLVLGASAKLGGGDNPEVAAARARGVRITTFPELVGQATEGLVNTVVAGSFGKSTCTAMMAHILRSAGVDPGWIVGAISASLPATGHAGGGLEMVLEGDEYVVSQTDRRSKFDLYHPDHLLLTSLVHDHVNVFPTFADYQAPFARLLAHMPADGLAVLKSSDAIRDLADACPARRIWYDTRPGADWWSSEPAFGETTSFLLHGPGERTLPISTSLLGAHNVENIVGVAAYVLERGLVDEAAVARGVASFEGIRRRLDRLTRRSVIPVIEGFGSSYEKARSAIEAVRLHYPSRPLIVVFEPHTFSWRSRDALPWYDTVFEGVSRVLILPPPTHGADAHHQANLAEILERIRSAGVRADGVETGVAVTEALSTLEGDEVVLLLSSGPLAGLPETMPGVFDRLYG